MTRAAPAGATRTADPVRTRSSIKIGLGQMAASADPDDVLSALGLGSCIGLVMVDPAARVAGMVHVMLPESEGVAQPTPEGKYADLAVPALLAAVRRLGADPGRLVCKMAGGAQMFARGSGAGILNIGARNAIAVRAAVQSAGLTLRVAQTGGSVGRTMEVYVGTGLTTVRTVGGTTQEI